MVERTLVLVKPDAVTRGLTGEIVRRFECKGLRVIGMKMLQFDVVLSRRHYADHIAKPFYPGLEAFITSGPCVALAIEGDDAIALVRMMMGATSHLAAAPGTIRGDLAASTQQNLVHGSDSAESAAREMPLFFTESELFGI